MAAWELKGRGEALGRSVEANGNEDLWGLPVARVYLGSYKVILRERCGRVTQRDGREATGQVPQPSLDTGAELAATRNYRQHKTPRQLFHWKAARFGVPWKTPLYHGALSAPRSEPTHHTAINQAVRDCQCWHFFLLLPITAAGTCLPVCGSFEKMCN